MARARAVQPGTAKIRMNLTPMIDMTFLLNVFFLLTSQLSNVETAEEIHLPSPHDSAAVEPGEEHRLVINLVPDAANRGHIASARIGFNAYALDAAGQTTLRDDLAAAIALDAALKIDIRADRAAMYGEVYPILRLASASGAKRVDLVVTPSAQPVGSDNGTQP